MEHNDKKVKVAVVKREKVPGALTYDYTKQDMNIVKEMVKEALDLSIGPINKLIFSGDKVLLKVNALSPVDIKWGICTDARLVEAVISLIRESVKNVRIYVGDNPAGGLPIISGISGRSALIAAGIETAAKRAGAEVIPFDEVGTMEVNIPRAKFWVKDNPKIFRPVLDSDIVINMPKMKTHFHPGVNVTLGIKNLNGVIPYGPSSDVSEQQQAGHLIDIEQKLVDIYRVVRPQLTIVDGLICMEGQGPANGDSLELNVIVAGSDGVAVDAVSAAIMGFDPMIDVGTVRIADHEGLGIGDLNKIDVRGKQIDEVKRVFKRATYSGVGAWPSTEVYYRGGCGGCMQTVRINGDFIEKMEKMKILPQGTLEKAGRLIYLFGRGPHPVPGMVPDGEVFILGDCIPKDTVELFQKKRDALFIPGCPAQGNWSLISKRILSLAGIQASMGNFPCWDYGKSSATH